MWLFPGQVVVLDPISTPFIGPCTYAEYCPNTQEELSSGACTQGV